MTTAGLRYLAVAALVAALAAVVRFELVEPQALGILCGSAAAPWWCLPREAIVLAFHFEVMGLLALLLGVAAFFFEGSRAMRLAWLTLPIAAAGLILYNATWAAPAILLALLAVVRRDGANRPGLAPQR